MKNNICKFRQQLGWSQEKLGKEIAIITRALPVGRSGINKWESGMTERIAPENLEAMSIIFDRTIDEIFKDEQSLVEFDGKILANGLIQLLNKNIGENEMKKNIALKKLIAADNSNWPTIYQHWIVRYYDRKEGIDENAIDLPAVVSLKDGTMYIRKLQHGTVADRWNLVPFNPDAKTIFNAELQWAACVESFSPRKA